jgi:hypothetical protein
MTTSLHFPIASMRLFIVAGIITSGVFALALPSFAHAATYAFVNTSGEVNAVVANDPTSALMTAFNISLHSGVLLLSNQTDSILNGGVSGV